MPIARPNKAAFRTYLEKWSPALIENGVGLGFEMKPGSI
jgi:hypothetical protein